MAKEFKKKPFFAANVRDILDQYDTEDISYSRFVEMLNEVAVEWTDKFAAEFAEWLNDEWLVSSKSTKGNNLYFRRYGEDVTSYTTFQLLQLFKQSKQKSQA